jgi:hypothetical protein
VTARIDLPDHKRQPTLLQIGPSFGRPSKAAGHLTRTPKPPLPMAPFSHLHNQVCRRNSRHCSIRLCVVACDDQGLLRVAVALGSFTSPLVFSAAPVDDGAGSGSGVNQDTGE